ncbi:hypothetical protein [Cupriavidus sp. H18C1]|uniref:hypothetical protein n=1 Tax=Cupriavidus sp. H18C1 TaxID=3241601 RepID=UPI003BB956CD
MGNYRKKIFKDEWKCFLFLNPGIFFAPMFASIVVDLMGLEAAKVTCIHNIDVAQGRAFSKGENIFIDKAVCESRYKSFFENGGAGETWAYGIDRYVAASDVGGWCFYFDRENDIAMIAFPSFRHAALCRIQLEGLGARPIDELIDGGNAPLFPYSSLVPEWRDALLKNYGSK